MPIKDNFSQQGDKYAKYRPNYPKEVFDFLNATLKNKHTAWDCGTGNGQVAFALAKTFDHVFATDISQSQIAHAFHAENISYSVQAAEQTNFPDKQFDLITVAQAIHWFDFSRFYAEVQRTAKQNALLSVMGYGRVQVSKKIDDAINNFYQNIIGPYWDAERQYVEENYNTIPFPFDEINTPNFENRQEWTLAHFIGYLNTWSAVKKFIQQNGFNPVSNFRAEIEPLWGSKKREVIFPILLRVGRL